MLFSRVTVLSRIARHGKDKNGKPRRRRSEQELELLKLSPQTAIQDKDIWENNKTRLRFRKFPWAAWIIGSLWILGALWVVYALREHLFKFKKHKILKEYALLAFCLIVGFAFLYTGKIRTTIFDRQCGTLTIKKRNTCCDKRSIVTHKLSEISGVRAVHRGY